MSRPARPAERRPLNRERVLAGALTVADADGLAGLTIRSLTEHLGVKPMAVYHHVANKEEILDGIVDLVFAEFDLPTPGGDWRAEMGRRAHSVRLVLRRHSWSIPLLQSRVNPGPATLRHLNANLATLQEAGFSTELTAHAYALIDSYVYGFALSEASLPINDTETVAEVAAPMIEAFATGDYPYLLAFATEHVMNPDYDFAREFDFGLTLVLDGLAAALT